jgi:uncharacterized RDD family membrane protein YckC
MGAPQEGALAPDLDRVAPADTLVRDVPAFRKREPAWKDEVRERLKHRRKGRSEEPELPIFGNDEPPPPAHALAFESAPAEAPVARLEAADVDEAAAERPLDRADEVAEDDVVDLPMRRSEAAAPDADDFAEPESEPERDFDEPVLAPWPSRSADEDDVLEPERPPAERPAFFAERLQAASVDLLTLAGFAAIAVYFAARAARVSLLGLLPAWPYLALFLGFFGLSYASWFTGLTGQTLGKILFRLRVVDSAGAPPGHSRAALRAALGALGSAVVLGALPIFFDPARRALHDRLLKTRVVHL